MLDGTIRTVLNEGLPGRLDYYTEYLDTSRFPQAEYQEALRVFLARKYASQNFDIVIATTDAMFEFVNRYRDEIFPGAAVVFNTSSPRSGSRATGVVSPFDFKSTLDLAIQLHPDLRHVFVVSGVSAEDRFFANLARTQFRAFEGRLSFTYSSGLSMPDLLRGVGELPAGTIIYFLTFFEDSNGAKFVPFDAFNRLAPVANAPIYHWTDIGMGYGMVGGRVLSIDVMARATANLALRVLNGEAPETIPVREIDSNITQFDWRQLRRWGISEARLPTGSIIRFRQLSLWDQVQALHHRRHEPARAADGADRRAPCSPRETATGRERPARERRAFPRDGGYGARARLAGGHRQSVRLLQPTVARVPRAHNGAGTRGWLDRGCALRGSRPVPGDLHRGVRCTSIISNGYRLRRADGEYRWVLDSGVPRFVPGGAFAGYIGSCIDITERKHAEAELRESAAALLASNQQNQDLAGRLITAQEDERRRVARELHDDFNQRLALLSVQMELLGESESDIDAGERSGRMAAQLRELSSDVHNLSHQLHPVKVEQLGLVTAAQSCCDDLAKQSGLDIEFAAESVPADLAPAISLCLYRIIQESLRNVVRHSQAKAARVQLWGDNGNLRLTVTDNGQGFDMTEASHAGGLGLVSMQERMRLLQGAIAVSSSPGQGTRVEATMPLPAAVPAR